MRTLLIDNYDSFTFNLYQLLAEVNGEPPIVVRNDGAPWSEVRRLGYDAVVLSPGPGRPERAADFGICREALLEASVPILGVCLGHQGLCHLLGGRIESARPVMHGRPSDVHHDGRGLFEGLPSPFRAIRYHSLHVAGLPPELCRTAWTVDGVLMAVQHERLPLFGVQFHPESIGTEHGSRLLANFRALVDAHWAETQRPAGVADGVEDSERHSIVLRRPEDGDTDVNAPRRRLRLWTERLDDAPEAERLFDGLFAGSEHAFWLDSALDGEPGRFSYLGDASGPLAEVVTFDQASGRLSLRTASGATELREDVFDHLDRRVRELAVDGPELPFPFRGGYVGYLGYELEADTAARRVHRSTEADAVLVLADRFVVYDHERREVHLVCLDEHETRAREWFALTKKRCAMLPELPPPSRRVRSCGLAQRARHDDEAYLELISACQAEIRAGETYELCLTNRIEIDARVDPFETYRILRRDNPAPYAAYLRFGELCVLSSSPERFLSVSAAGAVETKPIKGTRPRGSTPDEDARLRADLASCEKDRAENLIIVDLLRNDLGRTCEVGSVHVPRWFEVESYATVHQLVSTVRGTLRAGVSAVQAVRAAFPGGSMTGAPKRRTLEILDRLEQGPRGVYSGVIGWFGLDGAADTSIVIRTIVGTRDHLSVGAGGAIVDLSEPEAELEEMKLKTRAPLAAIAATALEAGDPFPAATRSDGS